MEAKDYYELLGVSPRATAEEIKAAYRMLARRFHPDTGTEKGEAAEAMFKTISEAYKTLTDPERRNSYNKEQGYPYYDGGEFFDAQEAQEQASRDSISIKGELKTAAGNWDSLRERFSAPELRVGHQAIASSENSNAGEQEEEDILAWGEHLDRDDPSAAKKGRKGFLNRLRRRDDFAKRKELKAQLKEKLDKASLPTQPTNIAPRKQVVEQAKPASGPVNHLSGDRIYTFQITELESALGTTRELAFSSDRDSRPRKIEVEIPVGIIDDTVIEVAQGWERMKVRIRVIPEPYVEIDELDIFLRVPVTFGEAVLGRDVPIPTLKGPSRATLPTGRSFAEPICLNGKGLVSGDERTRGNLYIEPFIVLPDADTPVLAAAVSTVEGQYSEPVRSELKADPGAKVRKLREKGLQVLRLPVTLGEAIRSAMVDCPTPFGTTQIRLPKPWTTTSEFRAEELGLDAAQIEDGELVVRPFIVPPPFSNKDVVDAAAAIDQHYHREPRAEMPRSLRR